MANIDDPRKSVITALGANGLIAATKLAAAAMTGSAALLAEGFHSLADTGNQGLLLLGLRRADRPPDAGHPFGHGKERFFWAFVVAVSLFTIGAAFSIYEGVTGLVQGEHAQDLSLVISLGVLGAAFIFEAYALSVAYRQFQQVRQGRSWWEAVRGAKDPEVVTVLFEDAAALVGITIAAGGIVLADITGIAAFDSIAAVLIGLLLGVVATILARESKALLLGEAASDVDRSAMDAAIRDDPATVRVVEVLTMHLAPNEILVAAEVEFRDDLDTNAVEAAVGRIERDLRARVPSVRRIFVEPADGRGTRSGASSS